MFQFCLGRHCTLICYRLRNYETSIDNYWLKVSLSLLNDAKTCDLFYSGSYISYHDTQTLVLTFLRDGG